MDKVEQEVSRKSQLVELSDLLTQSDESVDSDSLRLKLQNFLDSSALEPAFDIEMNEDEMQVGPDKLAEIQAAVDNLSDQDTQPIVFSANFVDQLERELTRRQEMQNLHEELRKSSNSEILNVLQIKETLQKATNLNGQPFDPKQRDQPQEVTSAESVSPHHSLSISNVQTNELTASSNNTWIEGESEQRGHLQFVEHSDKVSIQEYVKSSVDIMQSLSSRIDTTITQDSLDNLKFLSEKLESEQITMGEVEEAKTSLLNELFVIVTTVLEESKTSELETSDLDPIQKDEVSVPNTDEAIKDLTDRITSLRDKVAELEGERDEFRSKSDALLVVQERLAQKELEVQEMKGELQEARTGSTRIEQLTLQVSEFKSQNESLIEEQEKSAAIEQSFREQDGGLRSQLEEKEQFLRECLSKITNLEEDIATKLNLYQEAESASKAKEEECCKLQERLEEIEKKLEESTDKLVESSQAEMAFQNEMDRLKKTVEEKDSVVNERSCEVQKLAEHLADMEGKIQEKETLIEQLKADAEQTSQTMDEISSRLDDAEDVLRSKEKELNDIRSATEISGSELQNELATKEHLLSDETRKSSKLERELADINNILQSKETAIDELHRRLQEQEETLCELQAKLSSSEQATHFIEHDLANRNAEIRDLKSTLEQLRDFETYANERISTLEEDMKNKSEMLSAAEAEVEDLKTGMDESETTLAKLKEGVK